MARRCQAGGGVAYGMPTDGGSPRTVAPRPLPAFIFAQACLTAATSASAAAAPATCSVGSPKGAPSIGPCGRGLRGASTAINESEAAEAALPGAAEAAEAGVMPMHAVNCCSAVKAAAVEPTAMPGASTSIEATHCSEVAGSASVEPWLGIGPAAASHAFCSEVVVTACCTGRAGISRGFGICEVRSRRASRPGVSCHEHARGWAGRRRSRATLRVVHALLP